MRTDTPYQRERPPGYPNRMARHWIGEAGGIVGRPQLRDEWGVTKQRVEQLTKSDDFPSPVGYSGPSPVWLFDEVQAWRKSRTVQS